MSCHIDPFALALAAICLLVCTCMVAAADGSGRSGTSERRQPTEASGVRRSLAPNPSLVQLKKQAKELLKAHRAGDAAACADLRQLPRLAKASDKELLAARVTLADAQFALARAHGFESWQALRRRVAPEPPTEDVSDHLDPFAESSASSRARIWRKGEHVWLEPIPRFPLKVVHRDGEGKEVARKVGPRGVLPALWHAMRMQGYKVPYHRVAAAAGEAFRFTFSESWNGDVQRISGIDALARACETLGFEYTLASNRSVDATLAEAEAALARGQAVLIATHPVYWHLMVGCDKQRGTYDCIGGDPSRDGVWDFLDVPKGKADVPALRIDQCKSLRRPAADWLAVYPGPQQVVRNAVFYLGRRRPVSVQETIRRTLQTAVQMHHLEGMPRKDEAFRRAHKQHPRWIQLRGPGQYLFGLAGLRAWADSVEAIAKPTHEEKYIEAHDITLGEQLQHVANAVRYLRWARGRCRGEAREHLASAQAKFRQAEALSAWRVARRPMVDFTCDDDTVADLRRHLEKSPAMIYIVDRDKKPLLDELGVDYGECWLGLTVLPKQRSFEAARKQAVAKLRQIIVLREKAREDIKAALRCMPQEAQ